MIQPMHFWKTIVIGIAIAFSSGHLMGQESRTKQKNAASTTTVQRQDLNSPTLQETLSWMERIIASEGRFKYRFCPEDRSLADCSDQRVILEAIDFTGCTITWKDWHITADADQRNSGTTKIVPLDQLDRAAIRVETAADLRVREYMNNRMDSKYTDIPARWRIVIQGRNNSKVINQRSENGSYWTDSDGVEFLDQSVAQRWAKALKHAAALCDTDSNRKARMSKEPF